MDNESQQRFLQSNWQVLLGDYHDDESRARAVWTRRAALIAIVFVMAGSAMDAISYPDKIESFLRWRVVCASLLAGLLAITFLRIGPLGFRAVGHLIAAFPAALVLYMVLETAGGVSPYYAGLNLIMLGSCLLLRWRVVDGFINACLCVGGYRAVAMATNTPIESVATSLLFLVTTAVVCCVSLHLFEQLRFREYRARWICEKSPGSVAPGAAASAGGPGSESGPDPRAERS